MTHLYWFLTGKNTRFHQYIRRKSAFAPKFSAGVWHKGTIVPKISAHARRRWMTKSSRKWSSRPKKVEKYKSRWKGSTKWESFLKKVRRLSNQLKKVNKIFRFSEDFGASLWEGIWRSGREFSILILAQLPLRRNFGATNLSMRPAQWMYFFSSRVLITSSFIHFANLKHVLNISSMPTFDRFEN